ncbi:MAG: hypothetical protein MHMPM18_004378 [Marteilia pararefringens]
MIRIRGVDLEGDDFKHGKELIIIIIMWQRRRRRFSRPGVTIENPQDPYRCKVSLYDSSSLALILDRNNVVNLELNQAILTDMQKLAGRNLSQKALAYSLLTLNAKRKFY